MEASYCRVFAPEGKAQAKADEETEELLDWLGDDFDPEAFDAGKVKFHSAIRRLEVLGSSMR